MQNKFTVDSLSANLNKNNSSSTTSYPKKLLCYVRTFNLKIILQKDTYYEERIKLMNIILVQANLSGHAFHDDEYLYITFSCFEDDVRKHCKLYVHPLYGDRYEMTSVIVDVDPEG